MQTEITKFYRRTRNPIFAFKSLGGFCRRLISAAIRRTQPPSYYYPRAVRLAWKKLERRAYVNVNYQDKAKSSLMMEGRLQLASGHLDYCGEPNWETRFTDAEETDSLHRWNWLLTSVITLPEEQREQVGLELVLSWVRHTHSDAQDICENSYSIGERISNFCVFWANLGHLNEGGMLTAVPDELLAALHSMAVNLADRLEYSGVNTTGNHALNNARALLFAGQYLGFPGCTELAFAVIQERLPRLVTDDGFLCEGSSHYHFLFTRWTLEMLTVADKSKHVALAEYIRQFAPKLVERCWFYLVAHPEAGRWSIPLIGDVSPDFTPDWLLALPWSSLALREFRPLLLPKSPAYGGWAGLWPGFETGGVGITNGSDLRQQFSFIHSHWHRVDYLVWTLFIYAGSDNGDVRASHRHTDLGSFVVFYKGVEVIVDCGRSSYHVDDPMGEYGLSALSHNTLLVDGCGPMVEMRLSRLPPNYRAVQVSVEVDERDNESIIKITHDGFTRLCGKTFIHDRSIILDALHCCIEDNIRGVGEHTVNYFYHFGPEVNLSPVSSSGAYKLTFTGVESFVGWFGPDGASPTAADHAVIMSRAQTEPEISGWVSRVYGKATPCTTLRYEEKVTLPFSRRHLLRLEPTLCVE